MQVNAAPHMVHDVISAKENKVYCQAVCCGVFCLPCFLGCLCYGAFCSDEGELKKLDKRKIKHINSDLKASEVPEATVKEMTEEQKIAKIKEQILAVRKAANDINTLQSSTYKSLNEDLPARINELLDKMIEDDERLKKDKEELGVKKKESFLSILDELKK